MRIRNATRLELLADVAAELDQVNPGTWPRTCLRLEDGTERVERVVRAGTYVLVVTDLGSPEAAAAFARAIVEPDHVEVGRPVEEVAA